MPELTALPQLKLRPVDGHKGMFGRVLVVAGSRGMSGAAVLCGTAALRGGAGLVTVAGPDVIQNIVATGCPCYTTAGLPADSHGRLSAHAGEELLRLSELADAIAVGPGLGDTDSVSLTVQTLLKSVNKPIVLDADALNVLAPVGAATFAGRTTPTILTPHPGEFARLTDKPAPTTHDERLTAAVAFARSHRVFLLLKGHRTIVTNGDDWFVNRTGNPGMATGGSGDVLTGLIAALIGQASSPMDAVVLGAHVHGLAGDLAAVAVGQVSLTALDLLAHLPPAFGSLKR